MTQLSTLCSYIAGPWGQLARHPGDYLAHTLCFSLFYVLVWVSELRSQLMFMCQQRLRLCLTDNEFSVDVDTKSTPTIDR